MTSSARPSSQVVAAAVAAYVLSAIPAFVAVGMMGAVALPQNHAPGNTSGVLVVQFFIGVILFPITAFGVVVATGLLRRRNWARIAIIVWAGIMTFLSLLMLLAGIIVLFKAPESEDTSIAGLVFLFTFFGLTFFTGIWWLVLFTRKSVIEQFASSDPRSSGRISTEAGAQS